jgi:predicted transcriptional regulator
MATIKPNIKAQDVKGLKEFVEEIVQKELESRIEELVKNYIEKEDIDIEKLRDCVNKKADAKIIM